MRYSVVHGPHRLPVLPPAGISPSNLECVPFHQVISRGLLHSAEARGLFPESWHGVAPLVDRALSGLTLTGVEDLGLWLELAKANGVLSYLDSARCAVEFTRTNSLKIYQTMAGSTLGFNSIESCELWSVKEGHTSSVWIATLHYGGESPVHFALNIARDIEAGRELSAGVSELSALHLRDPSAVIEVLFCDIVRGPWAVPVVATNWISAGYELHVLPGGRAVAIEQFNADTSDPRRVASVTVRADLDSDDLWSTMLRSWISLGDWSQLDGPVHLPRTEINEGDWVYSRGRAVLCGLTPGELVMSPSEAVDACLSLHGTAGHGGTEIRWGNEERILAILCEAAVVKRYPALARALGSILRDGRVPTSVRTSE
jgi:hypothetical protein